MKILWVTNAIIGALARQHGMKPTSGQWLNAELASEIEKKENEIIVCTSGVQEERYQEDNVTYVVLPHGGALNYAVSEEHVRDWRAVLDEFAPDVILVWGTEYDIGQCVLRANAKERPSLIYIQGVMTSVAEHYRGGLTDRQIQSFTTPLERVRKRTVFDMERLQQQRARCEAETVLLADGIIAENDWSIERYRRISPELRVFRNRLPIKREFAAYEWQQQNCRPHRIVTTAAAYPLKGIHQLLRAIRALKADYPDVELCVPGPNSFVVSGMRAKLTQSGYCAWIYRYIKKHKLEKNVTFVGPLTTEQYAELMRSSELFVSASAIENHCSSLREAMSVGVPCVSSAVGGIPEYAVDGDNCSLYPFAEVGILTEKVRALFESESLRVQYSLRGKETIRQMYASKEGFSSINEICKEIVI